MTSPLEARRRDFAKFNGHRPPRAPFPPGQRQLRRRFFYPVVECLEPRQLLAGANELLADWLEIQPAVLHNSATNMPLICSLDRSAMKPMVDPLIVFEPGDQSGTVLNCDFSLVTDYASSPEANIIGGAGQIEVRLGGSDDARLLYVVDTSLSINSFVAFSGESYIHEEGFALLIPASASLGTAGTRSGLLTVSVGSSYYGLVSDIFTAGQETDQNRIVVSLSNSDSQLLDNNGTIVLQPTLGNLQNGLGSLPTTAAGAPPTTSRFATSLLAAEPRPLASASWTSPATSSVSFAATFEVAGPSVTRQPVATTLFPTPISQPPTSSPSTRFVTDTAAASLASRSAESRTTSPSAHSIRAGSALITFAASFSNSSSPQRERWLDVFRRADAPTSVLRLLPTKPQSQPEVLIDVDSSSAVFAELGQEETKAEAPPQTTAQAGSFHWLTWLGMGACQLIVSGRFRTKKTKGKESAAIRPT